jgi:hypothetical protein
MDTSTSNINLRFPSFLRRFLQRRHAGIFFIALFALLIRGGILLRTPDALKADPDGYRRLAENLVAHGTYGTNQTPTAYRPPLYSLLLTGCVALGDSSRAAIGTLHVALGMSTVLLVWLLARSWNLGHGVAALAALLVACDPILLAQSAQVMTETLAVFLAAVGLCALTWTARQSTPWRAVFAGVVLSLAALCRPAFLLWAVMVGIVWIFFVWKSSKKIGVINDSQPPSPPAFLPSDERGELARGLGIIGVFALGVFITLSPWAIRNQIQFGRPIITTTHGGYTLLLANNPEFYEWLRNGTWGDVWWGDHFNADWNRRKSTDELAADQQAYTEAKQAIHNEPDMFFRACLTRLGRFWSPLPHQISADESLSRRLSRYTVAVWYLIEFALAIFGFCQIGFRRLSFPWLCGLLLIGCLMFSHAVYWTDMRMRAPVMPVVAIFATLGLASLWSVFSHRRNSPYYPSYSP